MDEQRERQETDRQIERQTSRQKQTDRWINREKDVIISSPLSTNSPSHNNLNSNKGML
jgi:hypothetical protein